MRAAGVLFRVIYVGKIEIGKFVRIGTYMCISVHQLTGLFVSISNSPLDLQVAPSVSALTVIDRTNDTTYTDVRWQLLRGLKGADHNNVWALDISVRINQGCSGIGMPDVDLVS